IGVTAGSEELLEAGELQLLGGSRARCQDRGPDNGTAGHQYVFHPKAPNTVSIVGTPSHGMIVGTSPCCGPQGGRAGLSCFCDTLCCPCHSRGFRRRDNYFLATIAALQQPRLALGARIVSRELPSS